MGQINSQTLLKRNPEMVTSNIDGEIVMLSVTNGEYYGLDEIGSRIWELIELPITADDLVDALVEEFEVEKGECLADTLEFLEGLLNKGLILLL
jgi:hypothetical protein